MLNTVKDPLYSKDDSDLSKPNVKSFEYLGDIQDGSKGHNWTKGYGISEIATLINNEPVVTESKIWSTKDPTFMSKNLYLYELLENNINNFTNKGTYIFDRGYDYNELMKYLISKDTNFIIRCKGLRKFRIKVLLKFYIIYSLVFKWLIRVIGI